MRTSDGEVYGRGRGVPLEIRGAAGVLPRRRLRHLGKSRFAVVCHVHGVGEVLENAR